MFHLFDVWCLVVLVLCCIVDKWRCSVVCYIRYVWQIDDVTYAWMCFRGGCDAWIMYVVVFVYLSITWWWIKLFYSNLGERMTTGLGRAGAGSLDWRQWRSLSHRGRHRRRKEALTGRPSASADLFAAPVRSASRSITRAPLIIGLRRRRPGVVDPRPPATTRRIWESHRRRVTTDDKLLYRPPLQLRRRRVRRSPGSAVIWQVHYQLRNGDNSVKRWNGQKTPRQSDAMTESSSIIGFRCL